MFKKVTIAGISVLGLSLLFTASVLAGGGLVNFEKITRGDGLEAYSNVPVKPGSVYIVYVQVHLPNDDPYDDNIRWCQNCPIRIKLENPQANDLINQSADRTDETGRVYAKVASFIPGRRYVYAEVTLPDSKFTKEIGNPYPYSSRTTLNYEGESQWEPDVEKVSDPVRVPMVGTLPVESGTVNEFEVGLEEASFSTLPQDDTLDKLNKKIEDLENKLKESEEKQSFLEERFNRLIAWIRSFLPKFTLD